MPKIRVALLGVGNCCSSLVQGITYYQEAPDDIRIPGLMHARLGGYHVSDIEFTFGVDVHKDKVGKDLSEAILIPPNNTVEFVAVPKLHVPVYPGPVYDGIGRYLEEVIPITQSKPVNLVPLLKETKTDVVVNYLPVGSQRATEYYATQILEAGCAFVNCIPVFLASDPNWAGRFEAAKVPLLGDDIKSQVGATILHRLLAELFVERGVRVDRTYQLNFGGNTDFLNMLQRDRLDSKKISKTRSVTSQIPYKLDDNNIHVGPSDYVPWLKDRKICEIRMEGTTFGNVPLRLDVKLEVHDSPNSAGIVIDAIRTARIAKDRGIGGAILATSAYFFKSPPKQYPDSTARQLLEQFVLGDSDGSSH